MNTELWMLMRSELWSRTGNWISAGTDYARRKKKKPPNQQTKNPATPNPPHFIFQAAQAHKQTLGNPSAGQCPQALMDHLVGSSSTAAPQGARDGIWERGGHSTSSAQRSSRSRAGPRRAFHLLPCCQLPAKSGENKALARGAFRKAEV